jgi:hypothetical protein
MEARGIMVESQSTNDGGVQPFKYCEKSVDRKVSQRQYTNTMNRLITYTIDLVSTFDEIKDATNPDLFMKCQENGHIFSMKYCAIANKFSALKTGKKTKMCDECMPVIYSEETKAIARCEEIGIEFVSYNPSTRNVVYICSCFRTRSSHAQNIISKDKKAMCNACQNSYRHPPRPTYDEYEESQRKLRAKERSDASKKIQDAKKQAKEASILKKLEKDLEQEEINRKEVEIIEERERSIRKKEYERITIARLKEKEDAEEIRKRDLYDYIESVFSDSGCVLLSKSCGAKGEKLDYICDCGEEAKITITEFVRGRRCASCSHKRGMATAFQKRKEVVSPNGKTWSVLGYEDSFINTILEAGIEDTDLEAGISDHIPVCRYIFNGKNRRWFPDAFIKSQSKIIEIKSTWTYSLAHKMMKEKMAWCPYDCELWIYSSATKLVEVISQDGKTKKITYANGGVVELGECFPGIKVPEKLILSKNKS